MRENCNVGLQRGHHEVEKAEQKEEEEEEGNYSMTNSDYLRVGLVAGKMYIFD